MNSDGLDLKADQVWHVDQQVYTCVHLVKISRACIPEMLVRARFRVVRLTMFLQATGSPPDKRERFSRGMLMLRSRLCRLLMALQVAECIAQAS